MELTAKDVHSLQSNSCPVHKLTEPQQGNANRNATHTHNGACNSRAIPYYC